MGPNDAVIKMTGVTVVTYCPVLRAYMQAYGGGASGIDLEVGQDWVRVNSYTLKRPEWCEVALRNVTYTCDPSYGEEMEAFVAPW